MQGIHVGCAGWAIPKTCADRFPATGSHLQRYAARLPAVEINSSFYRLHRPASYERWAAAVPESFCFAVKVPKEITHIRRLLELEPLDPFLEGVQALGSKLGPLLVQLPPRMVFDARIVAAFFSALRDRFGGSVVCEPRHPSWYTPEVEALLLVHRVARVVADPAPVPEGTQPGGWSGVVYYRLHGSPRLYYSAYSMDYLNALAQKLVIASSTAETWCIFNNTASGAAIENALDLLRMLTDRSPESSRAR